MSAETEVANVALFDMDGTLAGFADRLEQDLRRLMAAGEEFHGVHWNERTPEYWRRRQDIIKRQVGWWAALPTIESGFVVLSLAVEVGYEIGILTKGPNRTLAAWTEKFEWCKKHVEPITPFDMNIVSATKGRTYAKVLVDDYPPFMDDWLKHRKRGLGLMPDVAANRGFSHPNVVRYPSDLTREREDACEVVRQALLRAFRRAPNQHWRDVDASQ